jgi:hypothetical protein
LLEDRSEWVDSDTADSETEVEMLDGESEGVNSDDVDRISPDEEMLVEVPSESDEAALPIEDAEKRDSFDDSSGLGKRSAALQRRRISRRMFAGISSPCLARTLRIWSASSTSSVGTGCNRALVGWTVMRIGAGSERADRPLCRREILAVEEGVRNERSVVDWLSTRLGCCERWGRSIPSLRR